jgi:hypothetical protein
MTRLRAGRADGLRMARRIIQEPVLIIDMHAHALSESFVAGLEKNPVGGLKSGRDSSGAFLIRRKWDER